MTQTYIHHRVTLDPLRWQAVAEELRQAGAERLAVAGGTLYGVWRSQIGRPRDELAVLTVWPGEVPQAADAESVLFGSLAAVRDCASERMTPTLRPGDPTPPRRQGNYAFRWFETPAENWDEFLDLCADAWPGFESSYDSQVIGLWRSLEDDDRTRRSLLMTRRPDLAMWERSKIPRGPAEAEVRRKLSRRYDICSWTVVYTSTLLTAVDRDDTARWT